jgi:uncharacterized protein YbjT (DUF2867 family)
MPTNETIAVVGATGAQGGGLARAILADPDGAFQLRALTRNPRSQRAVELAARGGDVVEANLDDLESLKRAFRGAHAAYCVTNYWEYFSPERELAQAANMAEAARDARLQHVIWSTLEDTRLRVPLADDRMPTLMGRYKVPHFDAKGEANREFMSRGVPTTFLLTSFYWDNLIHLGLGPQRGPDGALAITMPMGNRKLPGIAATDIGGCALGIFARGQELVGRTIGIAGEHLTGEDMASALSIALRERVRFNDVSPDVYRALGFPGADDLGNMFQYKRDFNDEFCRVRDLQESRRLNPALQSFADWLARNKDRIPVKEREAGA